MAAPLVPLAAGAARAAGAVRAVGPALAALTRMLNQLRPAAVKVAEALARWSGSFKELIAKSLTVEKVMAALGKATTFVSVLEGISKLASALARVKKQLGEAAVSFGLFDRGRRAASEEAAVTAQPPAEAAASPAAAQVLAVTGTSAAGDSIRKAGDEAGAAAEKVGALQGALQTLGDQGFGPAATAAEVFQKPLQAVVYVFQGFAAVTETASSFDQLRLSLETLLGSTEAAGKAFELIQDFAGRTPFSVESTTAAFRQLWEAGIEPTEERLTAFGNVAGAFGKDLTAVTAAISGVDLGKLDGLEELGFQVEAQGNRLKISFQGITTTVGNSSREVARYLEQLGSTRFSDGIERQAATFTAGFDEVEKAFLGLMAALGSGGLLSALESLDTSLAQILVAALPVAELLGRGLGEAMRLVAGAAEFLAEHAGIVASVLVGFTAAGAVAALGELVQGLGVAKGALLALGQAVLANPIGLIVGVIAAVVAALVIFKDETLTIGETSATVGEWLQAVWEVTKDRLLVLWEKLKQGWAVVRDFLVTSWEIIRDTVAGSVQDIRSILARLVAGAAEVLGGLGRILGAVFGALIDGIKAGINFMIAAIASIPQAVGAAVEAIREGDFAGAFERIREATAGTFDKDFVGDFTAGLADRIGRFAAFVGDVVRFTAEGVKNDVVQFGQDIAATAARLAATRPVEGGGLPRPPGRNLPGEGGAGDAEAAATRALEAIRAGAAEAQAAFDELVNAPLDQVAEKYQRFSELAKKVTGIFQEQRTALEKLPPKHRAVVQALEELNREITKLGGNTAAAKNLEAMREPLSAVARGVEETAQALAGLEGASILDVHEKLAAFEGSAKKTHETVDAARKAFGQLSDVQGEVAKATEQLDAATRKVGDSQQAAAAAVEKFGAQTIAAAQALEELERAQPSEGPAKAAAFRDEMAKLRVGILAAAAALATLAPGEGYNEALEKLRLMQEAFQALSDRGKEFGVDVAAATQQATDEMSQYFQSFVDGVSNAFESALADLFKGSSKGFEDLFNNIGDMFADMLAKMITQWLQARLFQQTGQGTSSFSQFQSGFTGTGGAVSAAFLGAGIGAYGSSALGGSADTGALLGTAGSIIGYYIGTGAAVGGFWGAVIGAVIGALVAAFISQKPDIRGYATLEVSKGYAVIEAFRTQGKADAVQLQKYAKGVVDAINEIVYLSGGALVTLGKVTLGTKDNKFYRVIDAAGITHKFGEDLKAATDYAVIQALKGAQFEGLSPEVQAAFNNTVATTIEELTSDIEFAVMVRDLDLEPVTKDLRNLMKSFSDMRERARALGISLDKVDDAFNRAVEDMKKNILSGLKPFQEAGLTDVEREALRISEAFEEMRENARLFNEELERQRQARTEEIQNLEAELARQRDLLAQAQENPEAFLPPELIETFAGLGRDLPQGLLQGVTHQFEEAIKRLIEEIARLQGLNAEQTPIDTSEIDAAEEAARAALRQRVRDALKPYQWANLTPVQQQLRELDDTFEKLRRDARAAGVSMGEVNQAYANAREAIRRQVMDQLQPYLDLAAGLTPLEVELRDLGERFDELRTNAGELGISMDTVNRAEQAALAQLRERFEDELAAFGGENPFVAQLDELKEKFEELKKNAEALGLSTDRVNEAYRRALDNLQKQFQEGIQSYLDYGRGLSDLAVRHRDLTRFFEEQREAARALDEAMGFTGGGGPNEQLLDEAQAAAFQQLVDEFKASLQDLRDAGLTPTEIAVRDMRDRFAQLREDAELLGLSVDELTRLEIAAIDRLRGELDAQLDRYLLTEEEQQQRSLEQEFLTYLRDALALYTYEPGSGLPEEPEPFPGARRLEKSFDDVKSASEELARAFRTLRQEVVPDGTTTPPPPGTPGGTPGPTPGELVARVLDLLEPWREGRGLEDVPEEQRQAIDAASTQVSLLLEQLRLGMTDDTGALQAALGNLTALLQQSGIEIDGSLLALTEALGSGDIEGFLNDLRDGVLGSTDGFGALIDILLSGGDLSLPELMHQLANGTFDAIQAMLGMTELPEGLADALQRIGQAWEAAQQQARPAVGERGDDAAREAEQRQRDLDALLRQLEQFEDLQLSPAERELKKLNEQFDEMRENARRLGVDLDRVEAAYQIAITDFWERLLGPLNEFRESLALSELSTLTPQERLEEARARFQDLAARALAGDLEAAQQLQGAAQQLLQEGQSFFASGEGYQDLFALVNSVIEQVLGSLAPGLFPTPPAPGGSPFEALLAATGWGWRDRLATAGLPPGAWAGDQLARLDGGIDGFAGLPFSARPPAGTVHPGSPATGGPAPAADLSGVREGNRALLEEVRLARQQEHADAVELHRRVDQQAEELKEMRALLRRLTSTTQYGGRVQ